MLAAWPLPARFDFVRSTNPTNPCTELYPPPTETIPVRRLSTTVMITMTFPGSLPISASRLTVSNHPREVSFATSRATRRSL